jgi:uncharacterized protein (DUF1330 family)
MAAYLIAHLQVRDPTAFGAYTSRTPAIIAKYGGRFLVRGGQAETVEGEARNQRIVVVEFPSMEAARAFYHSPEYAEAKRFRTPVSDAHLVLVPGIGEGINLT